MDNAEGLLIFRIFLFLFSTTERCHLGNLYEIILFWTIDVIFTYKWKEWVDKFHFSVIIAQEARGLVMDGEFV